MRTTQAAAKSDDGVDGCCRSVANHVEHECRRGSNEAIGDAGARWHGIESLARSDCDAGDLLFPAGVETETSNDKGVRGFSANGAKCESLGQRPR